MWDRGEVVRFTKWNANKRDSLTTWENGSRILTPESTWPPGPSGELLVSSTQQEGDQTIFVRDEAGHRHLLFNEEVKAVAFPECPECLQRRGPIVPGDYICTVCRGH